MFLKKENKVQTFSLVERLKATEDLNFAEGIMTFDFRKV